MLSWQKIINLIEKTHDKVIVLDEKTEQGYVIMPLSKYEKILGDFEPEKILTEAESLDRINRDISMWQSDCSDYIENPIRSDLEEDLEEEKAEAEDYYYIEPVE